MRSSMRIFRPRPRACSRWAVAEATSRGRLLARVTVWWRSIPTRRAGDLFRAVTLGEFAEPDPFDAVVASLALHHVADLPGALDKIALLLRPHGRLVLNEHAVDRLDEPTARWYLDKRAQIRPGASRSLERCLRQWSEHHAELHGYAVMRQELDRRFTERFFAWMPYRYGELAGAVTEAEERALIGAGAIHATGFRYVGERSSPASAPAPDGQRTEEMGRGEQRPHEP
jgi:SAM-dependent methyltransferase